MPSHLCPHLHVLPSTLHVAVPMQYLCLLVLPGLLDSSTCSKPMLCAAAKPHYSLRPTMTVILCPLGKDRAKDLQMRSLHPDPSETSHSHTPACLPPGYFPLCLFSRSAPICLSVCLFSVSISHLSSLPPLFVSGILLIAKAI